jgi:hypothetical protein
MMFRAMLRGLVCSLCLSTSALAQLGPPQPVQWKASLAPGAPVKPGTRAAIDLSGEVQQGWHVYALSQPAGGPIPLHISLDVNDVALILGTPSGTDPIRTNDSSFQMETQLYRGDFTLHVPVEVKNPPA